MLNALLSLTRPLIVLDTETTGIDTQNDRIVEIGFQVWTAEGMQKEWRSLVNPGIPIPLEASKVHGIFDLDVTARCQLCQLVVDDVAPDRCRCETPKRVPRFSDLASNLARGFTNCDYAGKNVRFDLRLVAAEMIRAGVQWSYTGARIIDAERLEALAVPRTLSHLHEKYVGHKHDGAHGAMSDVRASTTVIVHQLEAHAVLPRDLDALHEMQWPGWLCDGGQFKMVGGVATCTFGKWRGKPMRDIPADYWDWLLRSDFPADVKALASAAKLGQFP